jgi:hypothetical protein
MFGSFLLGFVGWVLQVASILVIAVGAVMISHQQPGSWVAFGIAFAMIFIGSYLKYLSRQSVRVKQ